MKLIVGLGNPGRRYEQTRHNVGFMVASKVAAMIHADTVRSRFEAEVAEGLAGEKLVVLCPQTYMNASGKSVRKACDFYKLSPDDVLVICDDLDLPPGRLRFRRWRFSRRPERTSRYHSPPGNRSNCQAANRNRATTARMASGRLRPGQVCSERATGYRTGDHKGSFRSGRLVAARNRICDEPI